MITLKRIGENEGLAIPASSVLAPKPAANAYAKGADAMRKAKFDEAEKQFGSAVRLYPEYAQAYSGLGQALENDRAVEITGRALKLNPTEFPSIYYYRALALRRMQRLAEAEESVRMAMEWDVERQLPRAPYLLGLILEQKGDRTRAAKAFEEYARWTPNPADAGEAAARAARLRSM